MPADCSLCVVEPGLGCAGSTATLTLTVECYAACGTMAFSMSQSVQGIDVHLPAEVPCTGAPGEHTFTVDIEPDAEVGDIVFDIIGTTPGAECTTQAVVSVVRIHPQSVSFSGPDMREVMTDFGAIYPSTHWKDNSNPPDDDNDDPGDYNILVVYPRGTRMQLSATFAIEPPDALGSSVEVTGTATVGETTYVFDRKNHEPCAFDSPAQRISK